VREADRVSEREGDWERQSWWVRGKVNERETEQASEKESERDG